MSNPKASTLTGKRAFKPQVWSWGIGRIAFLLFLSSRAAAASSSSPSAACSCNDLAACRNVAVGTLKVLSAQDHDDFHHDAVDGDLHVTISGDAWTKLDFVLESLVCVTGELVIWKNDLTGVNMVGMFPNLETVSGSLTVDLNTNIYGLGPSAFNKLQHVQKRILVCVPVTTVLLRCAPVHTPRCMRAVPVPCPARSASQQPSGGTCMHGNIRRRAILACQMSAGKPFAQLGH